MQRSSTIDIFPWYIISSLFAMKPVNAQKHQSTLPGVLGVRLFWTFLFNWIQMQLNVLFKSQEIYFYWNHISK